MKDGSTHAHADRDMLDLHLASVRIPATPFHCLDRSQVVRFEVVEGNQPVFAMEGCPRNVRKRTTNTIGGPHAGKVVNYVVILPGKVVFVFDCGEVVELPAMLPVLKAPVIFPLTIGKVVAEKNGDVQIGGKVYPSGYSLFREIIPVTPQDHHVWSETEADLRP